MKAKFGRGALNDQILIMPETTEEFENLRRWDNCVLSTEFDHGWPRKPEAAALIIVKEI